MFIDDKFFISNQSSTATRRWKLERAAALTSSHGMFFLAIECGTEAGSGVALSYTVATIAIVSAFCNKDVWAEGILFHEANNLRALVVGMGSFTN